MPLVKSILTLLIFVPILLLLCAILGRLIFHNDAAGIILGIALVIWGVRASLRNNNKAQEAARAEAIARGEAEAAQARQQQAVRDQRIGAQAVREYQSFLAQQELEKLNQQDVTSVSKRPLTEHTRTNSVES